MGWLIGVRFQTGAHHVQIDAGTHPTSCRMGNEGPDREADPSPSYNGEVKNVWTLPPLPQKSTLRGA